VATHNLAIESLQPTFADYLDWHTLRGSSARHREDITRMLTAFAEATDTGLGWWKPWETVPTAVALLGKSLQKRSGD
jgi:hypothetical protein